MFIINPETRKKLKYTGYFIGIIIGLFLFAYIQQKQAKADHQKLLQKYEEKAWGNYNNGLYILQKDYVGYDEAKEASQALYIFSLAYKEHIKAYDKGELTILDDKKYANATNLYWYATALEKFQDLKSDKQYSCDKALEALHQIPSDYNGELADKINNYKNYVKQEKIKNQKLRDIIAKEDKYEQKHSIHIGDSGYKVLQVFGEPDHKNKTTTANGTREQWVYPNGTYIYIENGSVTSWQMKE